VGAVICFGAAVRRRQAALCGQLICGQPIYPAAVSISGDEQPVIPDRASEDSDAAWGERPPPDDDERLNADRPPHHEEPSLG